MSRSASQSCRSGRVLAVAIGFLLVVLGAPALPAHADPIADWPDGAWAATCAGEDSEFCIESASVTPIDGEATAITEYGMGATVNTLGGFVTSFNWDVFGWNGEAVTPQVRAGEVRLVVRTGGFVPRYTFALASNMRVTRVEDDDGNWTVTITGRMVEIDWTTSEDLFASCVAGVNCGDENTMADPNGTGPRFMGNTQDLEGWGDEALLARFDGMYLASDAQARPVMVDFSPFPEPHWSMAVLGNPHLDLEGNPVRGSFNAWLPPGYFTALDTTATAAAAVGFNVVSTVNGTAVSVPATVSVQDGGVGIDVADIGYSVHRIDVYSEESEAVPGATVPTVPQTVAVEPADQSAAVTWTAPASSGGHALTGYTARAFTAESEGTIAGSCTTTTTSCTISELENGTTYHVAVSAANQLGEGPSASRVSVTPAVPVDTVPDAPGGLALAPGNGTLAATWSAPASDGGEPVTGYTVRAYAGAEGGDAVSTCSATAPTTTCTLTGLTNGTAYHVAATATNDIGAGEESTPRITGTPRTVPGAPSGLALTAAVGAIHVAWSAPASDGGAAIASYTAKAYLAASGGSAVQSCASSAVDRACDLDDLTNGTPYHVAVLATNAAGSGAESERVAMTPRVAPPVPAMVAVIETARAVRVNWQAPASTGGSRVTGYTVRAYLAESGGEAVKTCLAVASARTCNLTGLTNGTAYHVSVAAKNAVGAGPESARIEATPRSKPSVARAVKATGVANRVHVTWLAPASTGGSPVLGYRVNVYLSGTTAAVGQCSASASARSCTTGLLRGAGRYHATVTARNVAGSAPASARVAVRVPR